MKKFNLLMLIIFMFFIGGCSGGSDSGTSASFSPSIASIDNVQVTNDANGNVVKVTGNFALKENNTYFSNIEFSNLKINLDNCSATDFNITPTTLDNLETASFELNLASGCNSNNLVISGTEKGQYIDTNVMTKESSFSLTSTIDTTNTANNDVVPVVSKIIVLPTYIKISENNQKEELQIITLDSNNRGVSATVEINRLIDTNYVEYGTLDKYEVTTDENGEAVVEYTAPDDISAMDNNYSIIFKIKDSSVEFNTTLSFIQNDSNATEYSIELVAPSSFAVDSEGSFSVKIVKKTDSSTYINDDLVYDVNVTSLNNLISFNADKNQTTYEYKNSSLKSIDVYSDIHSGIEFIDVNASIFDGEKNITISQLFKVTVLSGPIHALSINYLSTEYNSTIGLFIDKYTVHAVDKYSNPANAGSKIYFGAVNGIKIAQRDDGNISYRADINKTEFNTTNGDFVASDVESGDILAILAGANRLSETYLGGWIIDEVVDSDTLNLVEKYTGTFTDKLNFVVGNEKRYDSCSDTVRLVDFSSTDGTYEVDSNGIAYITAKYDPYLVGKTVTFFANANSNERVGGVLKRILKGTISDSGELSCTADETKDTNCSLTFTLNVNDDIQLQNTLLRGTFIANDDGGSCVIISESNFTDCNGKYKVNIEVEKNTTCNVKWSRAVDYEY